MPHVAGMVVGTPPRIATKTSPELVNEDGMPQVRAPGQLHGGPECPSTEIVGNGVPSAPTAPEVYRHPPPAYPGVPYIGVGPQLWILGLQVGNYAAYITAPAPPCRA
jgi:hypothetical protein